MILKGKPWLAAILSLFLVPGLPQLLSGRLTKGAILLVGTTLWLPIAFFKLAKDVALVVPDLPEGSSLSFADLQAALAPLSGNIGWYLLPLLVLWFYSMAECFVFAWQARK